ncbi:MAG: Mov34/MPN/PAD-1 family protein [Nitrospirae bacterium]|nr:Mov34/MPN/PAD-1 family protein [Nitrospirota bacterium]
MKQYMLTSDAIEAVSVHAKEDYPAECCGIVVGSGSTQQAHRCRNLQDELHGQDPKTHPRTSREAYAIDRQEMERIIDDAAAKGDKVIAFYHSHIDCGAYFSDMDKEVQTVFGEPEFPDALHLVVSVYEGQARQMKGFLWHAEKQDFICVIQ